MAIVILDPNEEFAHTHATESRSQCLRGEVSVTFNGVARTLGVGETAELFRFLLRLRGDLDHFAFRLRGDFLRFFVALRTDLLGELVAFRDHPLEHRLAILERQVRASDLHVNDLDAELARAGAEQLADAHHQLAALARHDLVDRDFAKDATNGLVHLRRQPLLAARDRAHRLIEQHRIDNAITGEGVDPQALLIAGDDFDFVLIELKIALVDEFDVFNEGRLEFEAGRRVLVRRIAKSQHNRGFRLRHDERGVQKNEERDEEGAEKGGDGGMAHHWAPFLLISFSGR